jgi:hypothetical protein
MDVDHIGTQVLFPKWKNSWNSGMMEWWKKPYGMLEYWNNGYKNQ